MKNKEFTVKEYQSENWCTVSILKNGEPVSVGVGLTIEDARARAMKYMDMADFIDFEAQENGNSKKSISWLNILLFIATVILIVFIVMWLQIT